MFLCYFQLAGCSAKHQPGQKRILDQNNCSGIILFLMMPANNEGSAIADICVDLWSWINSADARGMSTLRITWVYTQ